MLIWSFSQSECRRVNKDVLYFCIAGNTGVCKGQCGVLARRASERTDEISSWCH